MAFVTVAGENLIALKQGTSTVLVVSDFVLANIAGLGAEPVDRVETLPIAGDIVHTQAVSHQGYVNADQVVFSLAMDSTVGDFDFNWVGLRADDGTLLACAHIPLQQKRANAGAVPGNNLTRNFLLAFSGIATTTAIAVPAETWQIDFTTRLLQIDERERLSNFDIYGSAAFFGNGFKVSLIAGSNYKVAAGIGYVGGIRCQLDADAVVVVAGLPKSIWVDASLQGDINGVTAVFAFVASAAALANYTDGFGFKHFVAKVVDVSAGGVLTDGRTAAKTSFTPVQQGGGAGQLSNKLYLGWSGVRLKAAVDGTDLGNVVFDADLALAIPVATVFYRAVNAIPAGFLVCDGSFLSTVAYNALFVKIGYLFGAAGPGGSFPLPDLRGEFVRGFDGSRGVDITRLLGSTVNGNVNVTGLSSTESLQYGMGVSGPGIPVGATIADILSSTSVQLSVAATATSPAGKVAISFTGRMFGSWQASDNLAHTHSYSAAAPDVTGGGPYTIAGWSGGSTGSSGGAESRPRNIALLPIIKY